MKKDHTEKEENKDQKEQKEKKESFLRGIKKPIIFLIILAAAIAALSIFLIIRHKNKEAQNTEQTAKVERRNIVNSVSGTGKIISQNSNDASVSADFGLVVESVDVAVGDVVGEGQVLCKLDASSYENEIKDLNSQIASLEKDKKTRHDNYNRFQILRFHHFPHLPLLLQVIMLHFLLRLRLMMKMTGCVSA